MAPQNFRFGVFSSLGRYHILSDTRFNAIRSPGSSDTHNSYYNEPSYKISCGATLRQIPSPFLPPHPPIIDSHPMPSSDPLAYDLIGIGFGPANLALACALAENLKKVSTLKSHCSSVYLTYFRALLLIPFRGCCLSKNTKASNGIQACSFLGRGCKLGIFASEKTI